MASHHDEDRGRARVRFNRNRCPNCGGKMHGLTCACEENEGLVLSGTPGGRSGGRVGIRI